MEGKEKNITRRFLSSEEILEQLEESNRSLGTPSWFKNTARQLVLKMTSEPQQTEDLHFSRGLNNTDKYQDQSISDADLKNRIELISDLLNCSETEVLNAGISLIELAILAKKEGKKFGVVENDQPLMTEVVGF
jgi:hypothetical protein